jgi:hypothetical protein
VNKETPSCCYSQPFTTSFDIDKLHDPQVVILHALLGARMISMWKNG